jgi:pyrroline-5-carboxylate reductase
MSLKKSVGFIGGGQMCSALLGGLIHAGVVTKDKVIVSDTYQPQLDKLASSFGVKTTMDNIKVMNFSDIIVLAVKPHIAPSVLSQVKTHYDPQKLIVSICAGLTIESLTEMLGHPSARIARVMPNTPSLYGHGSSGYCLGPNCPTSDASMVEHLMSAVGLAMQVTEKDINAVIGVAGSAPAYVFMFIEALADGGVRAGLSRQVAQALAVQTVLGSAHMVQKSGIHPGQLKDNVASAGGATIAAVQALEENGFRGTVIKGVMAAANRGHEMSLPQPKL